MMNEEHIAKLDDVNADIDLSQLFEMSKNTVIASRSNAITSSNLIEKANEHSLKISALEAGYNDLANRMNLREQNEPLSSDQRRDVRKAINRRVYTLIGTKKRHGKVTLDTKKTNNVYSPLFHSKIWNALKDNFKVAEYQDIRAIDYDDAMAFIRNWEPEDGIDSLKTEAEENWSSKHPETPIDEYLGR